jgi:phosphoribosylanthranilate isomerase
MCGCGKIEQNPSKKKEGVVVIFLPKNDGEFTEYIEKLKLDYLGIHEDMDEEELDEALRAKMNRKRQKFEKAMESEKGRDKIKRDFCRMEAKRIQLEIDGKTEESTLLQKKLKYKRALFKHKLIELKNKGK